MSFTSLALMAAERLAPFAALTSLAAGLADKRLGRVTAFLIRNFVTAFNIDLDELEQPDLSAYRTFNEFFIRRVRPETRPVDFSCGAVCPVDGTVGECGAICAGRLIQAKGLDYSLKALVGGAGADSDLFEDGRFATLYLSPANYHRIHMPVDGRLYKTIHVPGKLFPVGRRNISHMKDLYALNERLICFFDTALGRLAVVMVGAALVGSINTVWGGTVVRRRDIETLEYPEPDSPRFRRGEEIGHFKYGSTVIVLLQNGRGEIAPDLAPGTPVKYGRSLIIQGVSGRS